MPSWLAGPGLVFLITTSVYSSCTGVRYVDHTLLRNIEEAYAWMHAIDKVTGVECEVQCRVLVVQKVCCSL